MEELNAKTVADSVSNDSEEESKSGPIKVEKKDTSAIRKLIEKFKEAQDNPGEKLETDLVEEE